MRRALLSLFLGLLLVVGAPAGAAVLNHPGSVRGLSARAAPVVDAGEPTGSSNEGADWTRVGSFTDGDSSSWTATVYWDYPSASEPLSLVGKSFTLSHVWPDEGDGTYVVRVVVEDGENEEGYDEVTVTVANVAPQFELGADQALGPSGGLSRSGSFTDPGSDTWAATVDWGQGSGPQPLTLVGKSFTLLHTYPTGTFIVTVSVDDGDLGVGTDTFKVTVGPLCFGLAPTIVGTAGADVLAGTTVDDVIVGLGGNDTITGLEGNDTICGGDGDDSITGGAGNDRIDGGSDGDLALYEGASSAVAVNLASGNATGGHGSDTLTGIENVRGSAYGDTLTGDLYANTLTGLAGNDTIIGGAGSDVIDGGDGDDSITGGTGNDTITGGSGSDWAVYEGAPAGVTVNLATVPGTSTGGDGTDTLSGIENVKGSASADTLSGNADANTLTGLNGDDTITGGAGNDTIDGGLGADWAVYEGASSGVTVNLAAGTATGGDGFDTLTGIENVKGSASADALAGDGFANSLMGLDGNDIISGGDGDDSITGGAGNDTITGGYGSDWIVYEGAPAAVLVNLATGTATGGHGSDTLTGIENVKGSAYSDTLSGDGATNNLMGLSGDDSITGGAGNDVIDGGLGTDWALYEGAPASVTVNLATGTATGGHGLDLLSGVENVRGSAYGDTLTGDAAANSLMGLSGNDRISGGTGNDVIDGGSGRDWAFYKTAPSAVVVNLAAGTATGGDGSDALIAVENIKGSAYRDTLTGNGAANRLVGLRGKDRITGAGGNDVIRGGGGRDWAVYEGAPAAVTVHLGTRTATGGHGSDTLIAIENVKGSAYRDTLTGNAAANTLLGLAGNDTLSGAGGNDILRGGPGNDRVVGGPGTDTCQGETVIACE